jgi:hypothetical protein
VKWNLIKRFTEIDLQDCNLTSIPLGLTVFDPQKIKSLKLNGNPLGGYHRTLIDSGASFETIIFNLKESLDGKTRTSNEVKVMVVGDPAVGKTTLLLRLYGHSSTNLSSRAPLATDGIDLGNMTIGGIRFMCWGLNSFHDCVLCVVCCVLCVVCCVLCVLFVKRRR